MVGVQVNKSFLFESGGSEIACVFLSLFGKNNAPTHQSSYLAHELVDSAMLALMD